METLVLPAILGVSSVFWVPGAILLFVLLIAFIIWRRRRVYFYHMKDLVPAARKLLEDAKTRFGLGSTEDLSGGQLAAALLFNLNTSQPVVGGPNGRLSPEFFTALTRPRPGWWRWLFGGPSAKSIYQRACELAYWDLPSVLERKERAWAVKEDARDEFCRAWNQEDFGFAAPGDLFLAVCERDSWVGGRLGLLGRALYPRFLSWLISWFIFGRSSPKFDQLLHNFHQAYLEKPTEISILPVSILDKIGINLSQRGRQGLLEVVVGRDDEIKRIIEILRRTRKNNPVLIGEAGVGKSAVIKGLAQVLENYDIISINPIDLRKLNGTQVRQLLQEAAQRNVIVFFDEGHELAADSVLRDYMKGALVEPIGRGGIRAILVTTRDEYRANFRDKAYRRRFEIVEIEELDISTTIQVLETARIELEQTHHCVITDKALVAAARLSVHFSPDQKRPDTSLTILDHACATTTKKDGKIEPREVAEAAAQLTGVNLMLLAEHAGLSIGSQDCYTPALAYFAKTIIGQPAAVDLLARLVHRYHKGTRPPDYLGPVGVVLFIGGTGGGKTLAGKELARYITGLRRNRLPDMQQVLEEYLIRIDMNAMTESHTAARIIGAPPGYVGYREGGSLSQMRVERYVVVVLFEEIDKAHPQVYNHLLKFFEEPIQDNQGEWIDPQHVIVVCTANVKVPEEILVEAEAKPEKWDSIIKRFLKTPRILEQGRSFPDMFINRIDEVAVFNPITKAHVRQILLGKILPRLKEAWLIQYEDLAGIDFSDETIEAVVRAGWDPDFGARFLDKTVQRLIIDKFDRKSKQSGSRIVI